MYNQPVDYTVIDDENNIFEFSIKLTTYYDCCFNRAIQTLLSILKKPVNSFAEKDDKFSFCDTIWDVVKMYIYFMGDAYILYSKSLQEALQQLIPEVDFSAVPTVAGCIITDELFQSFVDIWFVSAGMKKLSELDQYLTPEMRKAQEKIRRLRQQDTPQQKGDSMKTYLILTYEFGYTQEQILGMTMYQINNILQYLGKSIQYKVSLIGAGNGLSKKVKFLTEKGK